METFDRVSDYIIAWGTLKGKQGRSTGWIHSCGGTPVLWLKRYWLARQGLRAGDVTEDGILCGVYVLQTLGDVGGSGPPDF
jgi:hypothetical protein